MEDLLEKAVLKLASENPEFRKALKMELSKEAAGRPKSDHKPGDTWKTSKGYRAMGPNGVAKTFDNPGAAKAYAKGEGASRGRPKKDTTKNQKPKDKSTKEKKDTSKVVDKGKELPEGMTRQGPKLKADPSMGAPNKKFLGKSKKG